MNSRHAIEHIYFETYLRPSASRYGLGQSMELFESFCNEHPHLIEPPLTMTVEAHGWQETLLSLLGQELDPPVGWEEIFSVNHTGEIMYTHYRFLQEIERANHERIEYIFAEFMDWTSY